MRASATFFVTATTTCTSCPTLSGEGVCNCSAIRFRWLTLLSYPLKWGRLQRHWNRIWWMLSYPLIWGRLQPIMNEKVEKFEVVLPSHMRVSATLWGSQRRNMHLVVLPSHMRVSATNSKSTYRRVGPSTWSVPITWNTIRIWYWVVNFANIRKKL